MAQTIDKSNSFPSRATFSIVLVVLVFSTIAYGAVDAWSMAILSILAAAIGLFWIADAWAAKEFIFNASTLQLPIIGLIVIGGVQLLPISFVQSIDPYATRFFVIRLIIYFIFFAAVLTFTNSNSRYKSLVLAIIIFGAVMAFFGILQRLADPDAIYGLRPTPQAVPFGPFVNQHHFAAFMEMTGGLTLGLLFGGGTQNDKRPLLVIAGVIMGIAVIFTSSRGGILSFLGVLVFVILVTHLSKSELDPNTNSPLQSKVGLIAGAVALIFITAGFVLFLGGGESLLRGIGFGNPDDVSSGRFHFWSVAAKVFAANPVIGTGFDSFGMAFSEFDTRSGLYRVEQAHNDYLQTLTDSGILGIICIAGFLGMFFRKSLRTIGPAKDKFYRSATIGALAGCFGIMIHSFFDFPLRTASNAFFFLALAAIAVTPKEFFERGRRSVKVD